MKYVVTEVWVRTRLIEAADLESAYIKAEPSPRKDMNLSNWHITAEVDAGADIVIDPLDPATGALNYRQVP